MTSQFFVSTIISNYNGADMLPECIESLLKQDYEPKEIIVADNGSTDESCQVVKRYPDVRWLPIGYNAGLAKANNWAAEQAQGEVLWFVNNDTKFEPECMGHLVRAILSDSVIFAADPMILDWNGEAIGHGGPILQRVPLWKGFIPGVDIVYVGRPHERIYVPWGCGGALMVRRAMFNELGGFDSTFFFDYEDADICWRAWLRGWHTVYVPQARLHHKVGESFRRDNKMAYLRQLSGLKNRQRFIWKIMEPEIIIMDLISSGLKALLKLCLPAHHYRGKAWFIATWRNLRELREILGERRRIRQSIVYPNKLLKRFFLSIGRGERVPSPLVFETTERNVQGLH